MGGLTTGQMLTGKASVSPLVAAYLQLESCAALVIPKLLRVNRQPVEPGVDGVEFLMATVTDPLFDGLRQGMWENLSTVIREVYGYLVDLVAECLRSLPDGDVGAVLVELWHIADEDFDPESPENTDDLNIDDLLPMPTRETPHLYLIDLVIDTIIIRLMKRHGPELLLAWSDTVTSISPT
ncbi:hypothetical protein I6A60_20355 [Frankia sp. AgB1.9]|uniref:hypothetical protein n=1 Tax=unclassified Frankia TaxID=2632575 RepID=UPI00193180E4|nr:MULTISPECIES: hypothetical protein [unclassified Frankia]MBL7550214.1 hypothetical protein [Frankia sp. AgB1.9]MBL7619873.1 hypothetical protein [Frankia sp. AgB1.8]